MQRKRGTTSDVVTSKRCRIPLHFSLLFLTYTSDAASLVSVELSQSLLSFGSNASGATGTQPQHPEMHIHLATRSPEDESRIFVQPCNVPYPVYPISFAFPEELIVRHTFVLKDRVVATVVPGETNTYIYKEQEDYYWGYTKALFGLTWKKSGWDCMRHYEIMASGALPYMLDIADRPEGTMFSFPTELLKMVLQLPGVNHTAIMARRLDNDAELINEAFDIHLYERLLNKVLGHLRSTMSTIAMAKYLLRTAEINTKSPPKVLFLAHDHADYQAESLFHGLRTMFGKAVVDYPKRHWMYRKLAKSEEEQARHAIYGMGFSYAFTLPDLEVDRSQVEQQIAQHHFDVVIYGITHPRFGYRHLYFLDVVNQVYSEKEVLFVDGSDQGDPETHEVFSRVCGKQGICFRRELVCS